MPVVANPAAVRWRGRIAVDPEDTHLRQATGNASRVNSEIDFRRSEVVGYAFITCPRVMVPTSETGDADKCLWSRYLCFGSSRDALHTMAPTLIASVIAWFTAPLSPGENAPHNHDMYNTTLCLPGTSLQFATPPPTWSARTRSKKRDSYPLRTLAFSDDNLARSDSVRRRTRRRRTVVRDRDERATTQSGHSREERGSEEDIESSRNSLDSIRSTRSLSTTGFHDAGRGHV